MSTFTKLAYHIVFSTKHRHPLIHPEFQTRFYQYIGGIIRAQNGFLIEAGGIEDHIHLLTFLPPTKAISDIIREIKSNSSKWKNDLANQVIKFQWQKGYGAFTVSYSQIEIVRSYIRNQKKHHQTKNFTEEYVGLLKLHNIEYDQKYLFEDEYCG